MNRWNRATLLVSALLMVVPCFTTPAPAEFKVGGRVVAEAGKPVAAVIGQALKNMPVEGEFKTAQAAQASERLSPEATELQSAMARARAAAQRASCANNLKQMGLVCKMYANEWKGWFPPIDDRDGNLMIEGKAIYPEYLTDLNVLGCPGNADHAPVPRTATADDVTDDSYFYLGWVVTTEEEGLALVDAYESLDLAKRDEDIPIDPSRRSPGHEQLHRLREGVERFLITDINNPAASAMMQSRIPVMLDRPGNHRDPDGCNVLYMDGHVEFVRYPSKFPMTEKFLNGLLALSSATVSTDKVRPRVALDVEAPELDVAAWINGEPTSLAALRGKTVVLAFWDSGDAACDELAPALNALLGTYAGSGVEIVSIHASTGDAEQVKKYTADRSIGYRVALDNPSPNKRYKGVTFLMYTLHSLPALYVIDKDGKVRYQDMPVTAVEEAVKALLK